MTDTTTLQYIFPLNNDLNNSDAGKFISYFGNEITVTFDENTHRVVEYQTNISEIGLFVINEYVTAVGAFMYEDHLIIIGQTPGDDVIDYPELFSFTFDKDDISEDRKHPFGTTEVHKITSENLSYVVPFKHM